MHFWTLWLFKLLYVSLDRLMLMLFSTWVSPLERVPEITSVQFYQHSTNTVVQCIYWRGQFNVMQINHAALILEALPNKIGVSFKFFLLLSCHDKGNTSLGVFDYWEMAAILSVCFVLWILGHFVISCLVSGGCTLRSIYTIKVQWIGGNLN